MAAEDEALQAAQEAREQLKSNYRRFMEREPAAFDATTFDRLGPELANAWERATSAVRGPPTADGGPSIVPLVVVLALLFILFGADRQTWRLATRAHARAHTAGWGWMRLWLRLGAAVAGRSAGMLLIVALSYFPIQAVFERAPWTLALTSLLWLAFGFRALQTGVTAAFAFDLIEIDDTHARHLQRFLTVTLLLVFSVTAGIALTNHLRIADDVAGLLELGAELAFLAVPLHLMLIKSSALAALPETEGGVYARLRKVIERYYALIIISTAFLLGLRAVGYVYASTFILVRGYGLLLLIFGIVAGGSRLQRWLQRWNDRTDEHRALVRSIEWALRVLMLVLVFYVGLRVLLLWRPLITLLEVPFVSVGEATISPWSIMKAVLSFLTAILVARLVRAVLVMRVFPAFEVEIGVGYAIQTLVNYALVVAGFFVALIALGVNLSAMTVVLASLGVGIGFGLQTITENLISGFILLFGRSVKKGDIVTVGDVFGQVHEVGARSVLIRTNDNFDLLIPSKEVVGGRIINWSYSDTLIRHRVPVGVSYDCEPREVERILLEAAREHDMVLPEPAPEVWLSGFGDNSVNFVLLVYFDCMKVTRDRLNGQLNFIIWDALAEHGIEIPFPQRDLHIRSAPGLRAHPGLPDDAAEQE